MKHFRLVWVLAISGAAVASLIAQNTSCGGATPFQILHFTKTNGFDHQTRDESRQLFQELGALDNYTVVDSESATVFEDLTGLMDYEVIVFANTSGNNLLNATQRANLEAYIAAGGAFLGLHAATDTYRDQSWPFYNQLVGGIVQSGPNHTAQNFPGTMDRIGSHPSTDNLPDPWEKREEYYYWELNGGQLADGIVETLRVRSTGDESYDAPRPMAWYQEFPSGARSYYTALGHAASNYTDPDNDFRRLLRDALCWCVGAGTTTAAVEATPPPVLPPLRLRGSLVREKLWVELPPGRTATANIFTYEGRAVFRSVRLATGANAVDVAALPAGIYWLRTEEKDWPALRFVKQ